MKRILFAVCAAIAIVFLVIQTGSSARVSNGNSSASLAFIHYQVTVHPNYTIQHNECPMSVQITDGQGNTIGIPQLYRHGVDVYNFTETGPVTGARIARMITAATGQPDDVCFIVSLADKKVGVFNNGVDYLFTLMGYTPQTTIQQINPNER
jgi:hypothetical protein